MRGLMIHCNGDDAARRRPGRAASSGGTWTPETAYLAATVVGFPSSPTKTTRIFVGLSVSL